MNKLGRIVDGYVFSHAETGESSSGSSNSGSGNHHDHGSTNSIPIFDPNPTNPSYYPTTNFSDKNRYDADAPYNQAPHFSVPNGIGLPLAHNFNFDTFIKTEKGNNRDTYDAGYDLPLYFTLPNITEEDSYQWDSFPAGEAQQFLVFSVEQDTINSRSPYNGDTGESVVLRAESSSDTERPFTISLSVTPYNAGPIPHIHWAEDEAFIMLQGEMDSWIGDPTKDAYELYEFPEGNDVTGDNLPADVRTPQLEADNVENYYYGHLMAKDGVYLPRGHAHAYRNASPNGDPLVFLTLWSRTPGYPDGGIEEFFTLSDPLIGRFYDTSNEAAGYGNLYNKNVGSEDGISNQQRFVDYFNTFPEYYVAMSRNFGSFTAVESDSILAADGSALTMGGNWNPSIPTDTGTFATPPPAAWNEQSATPWLATPGEEGSDSYYTPPAPNAPSEAVNFSTPFDPEVIQRVALQYDPNNQNGISQTDFKQSTEKLANIYNESNGVKSSDLLLPQSADATYEILTVWDRFSSLDKLRDDKAFKKTFQQLKRGGSVTPTNSSVHNDLSDNYESNAPEQMLLGKFEIKDDSIDAVLSLSEELREKTRQETGNLSFDYYLEKGDNTTIYYIEHYKEGSDISLHLQKSYTTEFFADFAKHLESGYLADGQVTIYPVNTPQASIYIEQANGIDMFKDMLESMPDLSMKVEAPEPKDIQTVYVTNQTDTKGFGSFLQFNNSHSKKKEWLYGVIEVDNDSGEINGVALGDPDQPSEQWMKEAGENATLLFETSSNKNNHMMSRSVQVNTGVHYLPFRTKSKHQDIFSKKTFDSDLQLDLPKDRSDLSVDEDKGIINYHHMSGAFGNVIQGMSKVTSVMQEEGFAVIDTREQPRRQLHASFSGFEPSEDSDKISLIKSNKKGKIYDFEKEKFVKSNSNNLQRIIASALESDDMPSFTKDHLTIEGGNIYTPVVRHEGTYFTPNNATTKITGSNAFEMTIHDQMYDFTLNFSQSNQMPLLN
ncbi:antibiotic biosynthesis monooxygenase [Synechococcus sp. MIT S1220]|uniref:antibiotic biosynthesis monooxygenase n=1 Tax=Synechococcus sp. MIT S1220 TaxID=3082549 RepID=UPI0039B0A8BB